MSSLKKTSNTRFTQTKGGSPMNRVHILLTVTAGMIGSVFAAHEAVAKILIGTDGDDTLIGTDRDERLKGRGGDDYLDGRGEDDSLNGSRGDDKIAGGGENDEIFPGEGDDVIYAGNGDDLICARYRERGLHRLRGRIRQGRDYTRRRQDQEKLRESPRH